MVNDTDNITLDKDLQLILIDGDPTTDVYKSQIVERIKDYIAFHDIAPVGITIVMNNAAKKMSEPSGAGTMLNLYNLFYAYHHFDLG